MAKKISNFLKEKIKYECYCLNLAQNPCFQVFSLDPSKHQKWFIRYYYMYGKAISMKEIYGDTKEEVLEKFHKLVDSVFSKVDYSNKALYTREDLTKVIIRLNNLRMQLSFPIKVEHDKTYYTGGAGFRNYELSKIKLEKISSKEQAIIDKIISLEKQFFIIKKELSKNSDFDLDND